MAGLDMEEIRPGMLAYSLAGHDKDSLYYIVKADEKFVWLSDGKLKDTACPKTEEPETHSGHQERHRGGAENRSPMKRSSESSNNISGKSYRRIFKADVKSRCY